MSCDELREALPLLTGLRTDEEENQLRAHLGECSPCEKLHAAYEADAKALAAYREGREDPAFLAGFASEILARLPEASAAKDEGELLKLPMISKALFAVAAAVLLAITLVIANRSQDEASPQPDQPGLAELAPAPALPAPRRVKWERAPMPRRSQQRTIHPVDESRRRPMNIQGLGEIDVGKIGNLIDHVLPELRTHGLDRLPPLRDGEQELRF